MSWTPITTVEQALELLERAVATRGEDFVYKKPEGAKSCVYVRPLTIRAGRARSSPD